MAVNNEDRVSTAKLLETLKGLQASRHLGSEPEVETSTETIQHEAVISPAVGTYANFGELYSALTTPDENRLPFKAYHTAFNAENFPVTITEPSGEYVELTQHKTITISGRSTEVYLENSHDGGSIDGYTGYALYKEGTNWYCVHITNGEIEPGTLYVWEMSAYTETVTTTTKTKHPIKQDYLPNADWNVNDPDADGYVQGRTHWVERTVGDIPVTTEQGMSTISEMVKPEGFKAGTTTWKPDYEAVEFEKVQGGATFTGYILAEDGNGEQITDSRSVFDGENLYTGVVIIDYSAYATGVYLVSCRYNNQDTNADYVLGVTDVVHKLPKIYYDKTDETALKNEIYGEINKNFIYKTIDFKTYTIYGVDRVDELEEHLKADGFTVTRTNIHYELRTWTKTVDGNEYTFVIRPANHEDYILVAYKSNKGYSWECLYTNIIFQGYSTVTITEEKLKNGYMIFQLNETNSVFELVTLSFGRDNTVKIYGYGTNPVIGTLSSTFDISITDNTSLWFAVAPHRPCQHMLNMAYVNKNGKVRAIINTEGPYLSKALDAHTRAIELICGNAVIKRTLSVEPGGPVDIPLSLNEEKTFNKNKWIDTANYFKYLDLAIFDEIIDQRFNESFEETYSNGETHTCTFDWWIDSEYNLHIKNTTAATTTIIPAHFTVSHEWFTNYTAITLYDGGFYVNELMY